tara:strand:- start:263 stop:775 length:513 start_codon:yes stop_codon:yes gene_type:complete
MANSTEMRQILTRAIVSKEDKNNVSADLAFRHTLTNSFKPYHMNLTSSVSTRNNDILSLEHLQTFNQSKIDRKRGTQYQSVDGTKQVYNLPSLGEEYQVVPGSMCLTINGLEQQSSDDQVTASDTIIDFYLSGSRNEQVVLFKSRQDHSGLTVDNQDSLIFNYKMEKYVG